VGRGRRVDSFSIVAIGACIAIIVTAISVKILHVPVAISVHGAAGSAAIVVVAIAVSFSAVITVSAVILAGRIFATTGRGRTAASTRRSALAAVTVAAITSSFVSPSRGWRSSSPLDLQQVIPPDPLVMHLVVGVIGITTALVLDKGEESA
jgi:hypothetical protein